MNEKNKIQVIDALTGLKSLDDNSIDAIITSPPYNISKKVGFGTTIDKMEYDLYGDNMNEEDYQRWQVEILQECFRVLKPTGSMFYNHKVRYRDGGAIHPMSWISKTDFLLRQEIIWDRGIAANIRGWRFWQTDERIYWLTKTDQLDEMKPADASMTSIWHISPNGFDKHPCPFPEKLVRNCLSTQKEGALVLDPFMGSGTTAIVAKKMGMDYMGFDVSKEYVEMAEQRIKSVKDGRKPSWMV